MTFAGTSAILDWQMRDKRLSQLVYTDPAEVVRMAWEKGWSSQQIIDRLMSGRTWRERRAVAKKYAPIMRIKLSEFMAMAGLSKRHQLGS